MLRVQLSLFVLLAGAGALLTPLWLGSELAEAAESSARVTTARAAKVAALSFELHAWHLVNDAQEGVRKGEKAAFEKDSTDQIRWHIDKKGLVTSAHGGVPLKPGVDLSGVGVVASALAGFASDGVVNLKVQPKDSVWHLAAAPVPDKAGKVGGVVVVGVRLSQAAKQLATEVKSLTSPADSSLRLGLVVGDRRYGDLPDEVAVKVRRGFLLGESIGIGSAEKGPFIHFDGTAWMVYAQALQTQSGPGFIVAATEVSAGLGPIADLLQNGLIASLSLTVLAIVLVLLIGRRLSASANTLAGWLSDWRVGESSPVPLASLPLHPLFRRVRGALDLALESRRGAREPSGSILDTLVPSGGDEFGTDTMDFAGLGGGEYDEVSAAETGADDLFAPAVEDFGAASESTVQAAAPAPSGGPTLPPIPAPTPVEQPAPSLETGAGLNQFKVAEDGQIAPGDPAGFGDMATGQFSVPETLLEQISNDEIESRVRPYENIFDDYVSMRRELGEDVDSITYERFLKKIEHTRAKILEDTGARDVRFSVKEKNGRASLRAMPVMEA